jgi:GNAT superfamily N-acetyltransferase
MTIWHDLTSQPSEAETQAVRSALRGFNAEAGFPADRRPLAVLLRDGAGGVIGGLVGQTGWRWLYIETLAIPAGLRGSGWGSRLMAAAEAEALRRGCIGARVDTYSFQARGFYERRGYGVVGQIADCPPGETRFSLAKRLDAASPEGEAWPEEAAPAARILAGDRISEPLTRVILDGLTAHATVAVGASGHRPFTLEVRLPGQDAPAGGLTAYSDFGWMFVHLFHLPAALRGRGLGAALMARVEAEARARGCTGIWLDTFSFQARPFYEGLGYRVFATLADYPPGHSRHYLMKRLTDGDA